MPGSNLGRHVFGAAALAFGLVTLAWPDYYDWLQLRYISSAQDGRVLAGAASAAQILGGAAIQFRWTAKAGAAALGAVYFVVAFDAMGRSGPKPCVVRRLAEIPQTSTRYAFTAAARRCERSRL